jgi:hypothetical protein
LALVLLSLACLPACKLTAGCSPLPLPLVLFPHILGPRRISVKLPRRLLLALSVALVAPSRSHAIEAWQTAIGYQQLLDARGPNTPIGIGVSIAQAEAPEGNNPNTGPYMPVATNGEFIAASDPFQQAVTFIDGSGFASNGTSGHTTGVGQYIYGNGIGLAKGANTITIYDANRWIEVQLNNSNNAAPASQPFDVMNHSWIGTLDAAGPDLSALQRYDYVIERDDVTAVVGANNNNGAAPNFNPSPTAGHPNLLAHSYNAIVAGRTDSKHSRGMTNSLYGPGRYRPDLVSSAASTSVATGQISSAAAVLRGVVGGTLADRSEPIKAMLMAGATKTEFANFVEPSTGVANPWNRGPTRPLDDIFGAGELNIYNSYLMTVGGRGVGSTSPPAAPVKSFGWDYQDRKNDSAVGDIFYNFHIPGGSKATELSVLLAWNVKVTDTNPSPAIFTPSELLQNLDLTLYNSTTAFMGTQIDASFSIIDNVEHVYQTNLGPGTYTLKVSGAAGWDYGLAWRMSTLFDAPDADFDNDGRFTGSDFLIWQQNLGTLVGALNGHGDADGDGDVDRDDLTRLNSAMGGGVPLPVTAGAIHGIPEPSSLAAAAAAVMIGALARRTMLRRRT